jgi:hypothetical protein
LPKPGAAIPYILLRIQAGYIHLFFDFPLLEIVKKSYNHQDRVDMAYLFFQQDADRLQYQTVHYAMSGRWN